PPDARGAAAAGRAARLPALGPLAPRRGPALRPDAAHQPGGAAPGRQVHRRAARPGERRAAVYRGAALSTRLIPGTSHPLLSARSATISPGRLHSANVRFRTSAVRSRPGVDGTAPRSTLGSGGE